MPASPFRRAALSLALAALILAAPVPAPAQTAAAPAAEAEVVDAEVRRVDKAQGKINLRHGEIKSLDMPSMSMWFVLKDPAWADAYKPGDKVRFVAEKVGPQYVVTRIEPAR